MTILHRATAAAAAVLGLPPARVEVRVRGPIGRPRARTDAEIRAAIEGTSSLRAAARALGVSDSTVRLSAKRLGISLTYKNRHSARKKA